MSILGWDEAPWAVYLYSRGKSKLVQIVSSYGPHYTVTPAYLARGGASTIAAIIMANTAGHGDDWDDNESILLMEALLFASEADHEPEPSGAECAKRAQVSEMQSHLYEPVDWEPDVPFVQGIRRGWRTRHHRPSQA